MENQNRDFMKKRYLQRLNRKIKAIKKNNGKISDDILRAVMSVNGEAVIIIKVTNECIYHPYSEKAEVNPEIYEYIESRVYPISVSVPVRIIIQANEMNTDEMDNIRRIIQNHYALILCDKQLDYELNITKGIALLVTGIALLALYFALGGFSGSALIKEIASVAATFALWEAVDCFILQSRELSVSRLNAGQLATAEIEFH